MNTPPLHKPDLPARNRRSASRLLTAVRLAAHRR